MNRVEEARVFLNVAREFALRSTCNIRNYGAIIVTEDGKVISSGYNGAPVGMPHCIDQGMCYREINNIPKGQGYERCKSVHAEMNALLQAGREAKGCNLYIYGMDAKTKEKIIPYPCSICARLMINAGIQYVIMDTFDCIQRYSPRTILEIREREFEVN